MSFSQLDTGLEQSKKPLLMLSNGHGEDQVAYRIAQALLQQGILVRGMPIVGQGHAYTAAGIPVVGRPKPMPSGGFIYQDWRQFWRDLRGGLLGLTWSQLTHLRQQRSQVQGIVAVGDIVVLLMAWWSRIPFWFVGTAKSDYYWRDERGAYPTSRVALLTPASDYLPWERWLMKRRHCRGVFVRDRLTAEGLQNLGIQALDLGNPMMDGLDRRDPETVETFNLLLLPGSRPPEAYHNWGLMMQVIQQLPPEIPVEAAIAGGLEPGILQKGIPPDRSVQLCFKDFRSCVLRAGVVLAMAGTATEQCVGLGKPVVIMPGSGPQFTPRFAEAQTRLLGSSVHLATVDTAAALIASIWAKLQQDPAYSAQLAQHGQRRMGSSGASQRIARQILSTLELG